MNWPLSALAEEAAGEGLAAGVAGAFCAKVPETVRARAATPPRIMDFMRKPPTGERELFVSPRRAGPRQPRAALGRAGAARRLSARRARGFEEPGQDGARRCLRGHSGPGLYRGDGGLRGARQDLDKR